MNYLEDITEQEANKYVRRVEVGSIVAHLRLDERATYWIQGKRTADGKTPLWQVLRVYVATTKTLTEDTPAPTIHLECFNFETSSTIIWLTRDETMQLIKIYVHQREAGDTW